jgi:outer membrane murein-binding lipoprotein Lpp
MKKKIINGILMAALLLAGTTSFVSCKDNVDDVENGIRKDMETLRSGLQTKIDGLETRVGILEANQVSVDQLNQAIKDLRNEINTALKDKADKSYVDEEVKRLEGLIGELTEKINKLSQTMVTGVVLQETLDCVVGTINLPGFNPAFLAAYVGENKTGMPEFPISGKDYNVDPDGNYLLASELPQDANGNWDEDAIIGNSGKNAYLINGTGNAGTLYFTINPRKVDPTLLNFDLINSRGEETGIKLSDIKKSDHLITFAIGKHGNGMTRADGDATDNLLIAPAPGVNVENEKTYLYEAKATVALDAIEKMHFDYTKFGYQNQWDAGSALLGVNQGPDAEAQNLFGRFQYLAKQVKAKNIKNVLEASLKILQDFYNGVYSQRNKLQKSAVRVSWDDGENDVISGYDITTVTINPLNYKQMILADQLLSGASWNITPLSPYVNKILKAIQARLPNVSPISINLFPNGTTIVVKTATAINATATVGGTPGTATIPAGTTLATIDLGDYINTAAVTSLENQVNALLKPYNKVKNATANGVMNRVNNYLNNLTAKIMAEFENQPAWKLTEPTLLFESREGINRMYPFSDADGSYTFEAGKYTFIMTSMTEEYIVPVYRKYIALIYGGKVKQYYSLAGNEKIVQLDIPNEACEIVYQTSDYYGNVVTKRYPINRK